MSNSTAPALHFYLVAAFEDERMQHHIPVRASSPEVARLTARGVLARDKRDHWSVAGVAQPFIVPGGTKCTERLASGELVERVMRESIWREP